MKVRICSYVNPDWAIPYSKSIAWALIELGVTDSVEIQNASQEMKKGTPIESGDYDLSFFMSGRKSIDTTQWKDRVKIYMQLEQLINCRINDRYTVGNGFDYICEPFAANMFLAGSRNADDRVFYCPIGYAPTWERQKFRRPKPARTRKDIDVLSWGAMTPGRINQFQFLKENGVNVIYGSDFYDDRLYEYIARAKIILWLQHKNCRDYAQLHCLPAQAQGEFVMVQNAEHFGLFEPDVSFITFTDKHDLLEKIKYYLKHEDEREKFAANAYEHLRSIPYTDSLAGPVCNFLNHIIEPKRFKKKYRKRLKLDGQHPDQIVQSSSPSGTSS
jgi:hypothetical protein